MMKVPYQKTLHRSVAYICPQILKNLLRNKPYLVVDNTVRYSCRHLWVTGLD